MSRSIRALPWQEQLNFLLTNRIPRRLATRLMGWVSNIENPLLTRALIRIWRLFANDLDLSEARQREFRSLQDCFTRELRMGARPIDRRDDVVISPCDGIVGEYGNINGTTVFQAKGFPYDLQDLLPEAELREAFRDGKYITLRLKSSFYHRFHAPLACEVMQTTYISGDTWNVNPVALKCVERLYCKNERAVIDLRTLHSGGRLCLVAVAAILVASIRLRWLDDALDMHYQGPQVIHRRASFAKGDELGYFQHGSTIILFATPDYQFCDAIETGTRVHMGQALMTCPDPTASNSAASTTHRNEPRPLHEDIT